MKPKLVHHDRTIELPEGNVFMGRDPTCDLVLDDPLASRHHAKLTVRAGRVVIEDLDSRNGVLVNGVAIGAPRQLAPGDRITIGSQDVLYEVDAEAPAAGPPAPTALGSVMLARVTRAAARIDPDRFVVSTMGRGDGKAPERAEACRVLAGLADRAFAERTPEAAEKILEQALTEVLSAKKSGNYVEPQILTFAASYAARLARALQKARWIDYVFHLFSVTGEIVPRDVVDDLLECIRFVGPVDEVAMNAYLVKARALAASEGPGARNLLRRSEQLAKLVEESRR